VSRKDEPNLALWLATRVGKVALSCPLMITHCVLQENSILFPCYKSFTDQACSVKMAWCRPCSFFFYKSQAINTHKKTLSQYPAILTSCIVNNPIYLACLGSKSEHRIWFILPNHGASHIIKYNTHPLPQKQCWNNRAKFEGKKKNKIVV